jgi:hypothetical protein
VSVTRTIRRRLTHLLVHHALAVLPRDRSAWGRAMKEEACCIEDDREALRWAFGCVGTGYGERFRSFMGERTSIRQLVIAAATACLFVTGSIYLRGFLAAIAYPHWYAVFAHAHKNVGIQLWGFFEGGVPEAALAAICGAALGRMTRNPHFLLAVVSLVVWNIVPLGFDLWGDLATGCSFSGELQGILLWWPEFVATELLVCLTLVLAFRYTAKLPPVTSAT